MTLKRLGEIMESYKYLNVEVITIGLRDVQACFKMLLEDLVDET